MDTPAGDPSPEHLIAGVKSRAGYDESSSYPALAVSGTGPRRRVGTMTTCDFCGRQEPDEAATLTWTTSVENGRRRVFCDDCSRANLRAMEGKLDSEFW